MGDRYILTNLKCAWCEKENDEVFYAESCNITIFTCEHCGKKNEVIMLFETKKVIE